MNKALYQSTDFVVVVEQVLKCLFKIMQTDPLWKIKALAIRGIVLLNCGEFLLQFEPYL